MDVSSYLLGLATLPALAVLAFVIARGVVLIGSALRARGWTVEFGGEDGEAYERPFSSRHIIRRGRFLWSGTFVNEGVSRARFIAIAGPRRGVHIVKSVKTNLNKEETDV